MTGVGIMFAAYVVCDTFLFYKGYNSAFWKTKTPEEKALHQKAREKG